MTARDSSTSAQRICPKCGHANSNISLFCAECGAVLNGASTGETGAYAPVRNDQASSQQTQLVRGGSGSAEQEWASLMASSADDASHQATAPLPKSTPPVSTVTAPAAAANAPSGSTATGAAWPTASTTHPDIAPASGSAYNTGVSFGMEPVERGRRGFWFGVIAMLLILIVLGLYGWSILPDGGFRDTVQGWF
jgi:hypothetical protein